MIIKSVDVYGEKFEGEIIRVYKLDEVINITTNTGLVTPLKTNRKADDKGWFVEFYLTKQLMSKYNIKLPHDNYSPNEAIAYVLPCTNVVIDES